MALFKHKKHLHPPGHLVLPEEIRRTLEVDEESLRRLGWKSAYLTNTLEPSAMAALIDQLHRENIGHVWKEFRYRDAAGILNELQAFEDSRRPTLILGYYGVPAVGAPVFYGASAISEKISHRFPYDGFPVLSRCFIDPRFRNHRLYAPAVAARVNICQELWGKALKGIHLGSSNDRVHRAILSHQFSSPFIYLGDENLSAGGLHLTRDYLGISLIYRNRLLSEATEMSRLAPAGAALEQQIRKLLDNRFHSNDYRQLRLLLGRFVAEAGFDPGERFEATRELIAFFEAVPVIDTEEDRGDEREFPFPHRKQ